MGIYAEWWWERKGGGENMKVMRHGYGVVIAWDDRGQWGGTVCMNDMWYREIRAMVGMWGY